MADRYLLESGAPDGYLLEDGTGVLLTEGVPTHDTTGALQADSATISGAATNNNVALVGQQTVWLASGSATPAAVSVTVPADANAVVISVGGAFGNPLTATSITCSFASLSSVRSFTGSATEGSVNAAHSTAALTGTGSQTVTVTWSGTITELGNVTLFYFSAADPTDFFRDDDADVSQYDATGAPSTTTSSSTSDKVVGYITEWVNTPGTPTGTTSLGTSNGSIDGNSQLRMWQANSPGASTTNIVGGSEDFPVQYQVSVKRPTGVVSHPTSGALAADAATISGSAAHLTLHTTTGALSAQAATISGSALHPHTSAGALSSQASTISGAAAHQHAASGALAAQDAAIAGSAARSAGAVSHDTSGALAADAATISGTALHPHTTTGILSAQASTISGQAAHEHATSGALASGAATISGDATHTAPGSFATSGALQAGDAAISGEAQLVPSERLNSGPNWRLFDVGKLVKSEGMLIAGSASMSGSAQRTPRRLVKTHAASGALVAGSASMSGASKRLSRYITADGLIRERSTALLVRTDEQETRRLARIAELEAELAALRHPSPKGTT